jgi:hypothetical protein
MPMSPTNTRGKLARATRAFPPTDAAKFVDFLESQFGMKLDELAEHRAQTRRSSSTISA